MSLDRPTVVVRALVPDDQNSAVAVVARGMRDNPINVAVFGDDPDRRLHCNQRLFRALFGVMTAQTRLVALDGDTVVGAAGIAPPGSCQPTGGERLRFLPTVLSLGPRTAMRMSRWLSAWAKHDLEEPHSHLGPLAIDPPLQGHGIGTQMLAHYCRSLDESGLVGYLETDKELNVRLYERHGFTVTGENTVLDVHCWYMRRRSPASSTS